MFREDFDIDSTTVMQHEQGEGGILKRSDYEYENSRDRRGFEFRDWADGLFYSLDRDGKEQLLDADGTQVMMEWEKEWMQRCADDLKITPECDVLEVGFGCAYSANRIQEANPRSHTIIECSEAVLKKLDAWAADKPNVRVVRGTWQSQLPKLGTFDRIFFDDYGEPGRSDQEMRNCPDEKYITAYEEADSHFQAFLNIVMQWHSKEGTRFSGYVISPPKIDRDDVDVSFERIPVAPPSHCDYFYATQAVVPVFEKRTYTGYHSDSTRSDESQSRSRSRSHKPHRARAASSPDSRWQRQESTSSWEPLV